MSDAVFDLIVRGGTCVLPAGRVPCDVGVRGGRVAALGDLSRASARETLDAHGLHVLPGAIDTQVHFREPGLTHKEDLATGTAAAVLGGVTAVLEMPNTSPPTTTADALAEKVRLATGRARCDFGFFVGATAENADSLRDLERLPGCCGVKVFMGSSTGNLLVAEDAVLARVLASGTRRVAVHAEDEARLKERKPIAVAARHPRAHPEWRDAECARRATERLIAFARKAGRRVHVLHVTSAEEMALLALAKDIATVETTPQHLLLAAPECYERLGTRAQMNPPIRDASHRAALRAAVAAGIVDVIGSDHAPHTLEEKGKTYPESPSGMPGVQTILPLLLDMAHASERSGEGWLTLERVVDLLCAGPARIHGLVAKGRIAVGFDADLTLVDLARRHTITAAEQATRCGWTPFDGVAVTGWPVVTIVRGSIAMRDGQLVGAPTGQRLRFLEALEPSA